MQNIDPFKRFSHPNFESKTAIAMKTHLCISWEWMHILWWNLKFIDEILFEICLNSNNTIVARRMLGAYLWIGTIFCWKVQWKNFFIEAHLDSATVANVSFNVISCVGTKIYLLGKCYIHQHSLYKILNFRLNCTAGYQSGMSRETYLAAKA